MTGETEVSAPEDVSSLPQPTGSLSKSPVSYEVLKGIVSAENNSAGFVLKEKKQNSEESLKSLEAQEALLRLQAERDALRVCIKRPPNPQFWGNRM